MPKIFEKIFFVSDINTSENVAINCLSYEENTCHQQWMGKKNVLRFCISLREPFSAWISFTWINKSGKGAAAQISTLLRPAYHVTCWRYFWKGTFWTFIWPPFPESVSWEIHQLWGYSFVRKYSKLNLNFENATRKLRKYFSFLTQMPLKMLQ